jgi:uncharacterized protein (DUF1810 family)
VLPFEATDTGRAAGAVEAAWGWRGGIDMLVNNAGISQRSLAIDTAPEVYEKIVEVDLLAPIRLTQSVLPLMAERGSGHIVAISLGRRAARAGAADRLCRRQARPDRLLRLAPRRGRGRLWHQGDQRPARLGAHPGGGERAPGRRQRARHSDANIEAGMDPAECARRILDGSPKAARDGRRGRRRGLRRVAALAGPRAIVRPARGGRGAAGRGAGGGRAAPSLGLVNRTLPRAERVADLAASSRPRRVFTARRSPSWSHGRKESHWMWFVFPQIAGLGTSPTARFYAIASADEARAILPIPCSARACASAPAMLGHRERGAPRRYSAPVDAMKLRSSMTLFEAVADDPAILRAALEAFHKGERDAADLGAAGPMSEASACTKAGSEPLGPEFEQPYMRASRTSSSPRKRRASASSRKAANGSARSI